VSTLQLADLELADQLRALRNGGIGRDALIPPVAGGLPGVPGDSLRCGDAGQLRPVVVECGDRLGNRRELGKRNVVDGLEIGAGRQGLLAESTSAAPLSCIRNRSATCCRCNADK
jgi:hypothetical protein